MCFKLQLWHQDHGYWAAAWITTGIESSRCLNSERSLQVSPPDLVLQVSDGPSLLLNSPILVASTPVLPAAEASSSEEHQVQLLKKQLQQQEQQALAASAQVLAPFSHTGVCLANNLYFFCAAVFNSVTVRSNNWDGKYQLLLSPSP